RRKQSAAAKRQKTQDVSTGSRLACGERGVPLAAIESRRIDGASDPRTPACAGDPTVAREREQKDDEPRGARLRQLVDNCENQIARAFDLREPLHRSRDKGRVGCGFRKSRSRTPPHTTRPRPILRLA